MIERSTWHNVRFPFRDSGFNKTEVQFRTDQQPIAEWLDGAELLTKLEAYRSENEYLSAKFIATFYSLEREAFCE